MFFKRYWVLILYVNFFLGSSQEGNYKFNNFGNRSILLVGNVTGSVSDLGLTYYNPSFLANNDKVGFSLNAKAYQLVNIKLTSPSNNTEISNSNFNSASTMAGGIFNLFNTRFAYSYLTKSNFNTNLNYSKDYLNDELIEQVPNLVGHTANIALNNNIKDEWTGLTWAYKVNSNFNIGISGFASIYRYNANSLVNHILELDDGSVSFYQDSVSFNQTSYGLFVKLGANYKFPKFHLGLNINLPYLEVFKDGAFRNSKIVSGISTNDDLFIENNFDNLNAKRKEPLGISLGAGIPFYNGKIHLNIDYVSGLNKYDRLNIPNIDTGNSEITPVNFEEERSAVVNFGIGAEYKLRDNLKAYGGFSTDFNAFKESANIFDFSAEENKRIEVGENFYHMGLGVDWKLKWLSVISGFTYASSSNTFIDPYSIDFGDISIMNKPDSEFKYSRWQFVIGIDVPILSKKANKILESI